MCLILFAWKAHPDYPLILAANRDEFHARPTLPAAWWHTSPDILAGRDLVGGGTWLGIDRTGRWAAVTNFRDPAREKSGRRSRGLLVHGFLAQRRDPAAYLAQVADAAPDFAPFNLLAGDGREIGWYGSRKSSVELPEPGIHGLSNALLDTPWPKVADGKAALAEQLRTGGPDPDALFALLADRTPAADARLPDTGVGLDWERLLSARFIRSADYGTRCSTLLLCDDQGLLTFRERRFAADGSCQGEVAETFRLRR